MKIREIILDFTSLLDIFMLILFFFILFSHFEVEEAKETANQALDEAAAMSETLEGKLQEADDKIQQAEDKIQQAEDELALLDEINHGKAANLTALLELSQGTVIQSRLLMKDSGDSWTIQLKRLDDKTKNEIQLVELTEHDDLNQKLCMLLMNQNYQTDDRIPFLFLYDGTQIGSEAAYNTINTAFRQVRQTYPHFYCMQLDISDFGTLEENAT